MATTKQMLESILSSIESLSGRIDALEGKKVAEPVKPVEPKGEKKPRRTRAQRIAEANKVIRPERLANGKLCGCGRSMAEARTGTKIAGKVVCHYCWTHR